MILVAGLIVVIVVLAFGEGFVFGATHERRRWHRNGYRPGVSVPVLLPGEVDRSVCETCDHPGHFPEHCLVEPCNCTEYDQAMVDAWERLRVVVLDHTNDDYRSPP